MKMIDIGIREGVQEEMSPFEVETYFRDKVICHFVRIRLGLDNPGNFRDYLETAKNLIISNIYDLWADKYDFVQQEDSFPWSETWQLKHILLMIAIYCKELTLKEWQGEDPEKKLSRFFSEIEEYFDLLPHWDREVIDPLRLVSESVYETELYYNDYLNARLWPFNQNVSFV